MIRNQETMTNAKHAMEAALKERLIAVIKKTGLSLEEIARLAKGTKEALHALVKGTGLSDDADYEKIDACLKDLESA